MENVFKEHADSRLLINEELKKKSRSIAWLASKIDVTRSHLRKVLLYERNITREVLSKINAALESDIEFRIVESPKH